MVMLCQRYRAVHSDFRFLFSSHSQGVLRPDLHRISVSGLQEKLDLKLDGELIQISRVFTEEWLVGTEGCPIMAQWPI